MSNSIDLAIITALPVERDAVLSRLDSHELGPNKAYYTGRIGSYRVIVSLLAEMGNMESGITATQLLERFQPQNMIMVGIAAGNPDKVGLGDVVVAKFCDYYELAKLTLEGKQTRTRQLPSSITLFESTQNYRATDWHTAIKVAIPGQIISYQPQVHFGPIGSGEKVIADNETLALLVRDCPELMAVAMEGAGVARAVMRYKNTDFIEIRGISDFADANKNDDWRKYAANAAAAFLAAWVRSGGLPTSEPEPSSVNPFLSRKVAKPDYFIGRDDLLAKVHERLQQQEPVLLVNGLGGIGKTAAAREYVNRYQADYHWVAWVFVQTGLRQDLVSTVQKALKLEFPQGSSLEAQFEAVMLALEQATGQNLLILDNANDADELFEFKQDLTQSGWRVLITSRCQPDDYESNTLAVNELSEADAMSLFRHHYTLAAEETELRALLAKIEYHTLLIELVAKAGKAKRLTIEQLSQHLDSGGLKHDKLQREVPLQKKRVKLHDHILAMYELQNWDAEQQFILRYFSVLPNKNIPLAHLYDLLTVEDENQFEDNLADLFRYGLLGGIKDSHYRMHALVQDVMFEKLDANLESCADLITALNGIMESSYPFMVKAWDYQEYAQAVAQKFKESDSDIGLLNSYLADFYRNIGQLESALASIEVARKHFENCDDTENLAISYSRLGVIHQALGHTEQALAFFELYNNLGKELYESNPKSESLKNGLAISYSKLGVVHQALGDVDKALEFFELSNQLVKELSEFNPKSESLKNFLAISYQKLGEIHQALGDVDKALEYFELDIELTKELYESNPKSVELKNGLAISYYKLAAIYQVKKIPFYKFTAIRQNKQQVLALYENAITLWQELYQTTPLDSHKQNLEKAENAHLQVKIVSYAPVIQASLIALFGGLYWLDWVSGWWLVGLIIWIFPLRLPVKTVLSIKIPLLVLLGLVAWFV